MLGHRPPLSGAFRPRGPPAWTSEWAGGVDGYEPTAVRPAARSVAGRERRQVRRVSELRSSWMAASELRRRSPRLRTRDDQAGAHRATGIGPPVLRFTNRTHRRAAPGRRSRRRCGARARVVHLTASVLPALTAPAERALGSGRAALLLLNRVAGKRRSLPARRSCSRTTVATIVSTHGTLVGVTDEVPELGALAALVRCAQPVSGGPVRGPVPVGGTVTRRVGHRVPAAFT